LYVSTNTIWYHVEKLFGECNNRSAFLKCYVTDKVLMYILLVDIDAFIFPTYLTKVLIINCQPWSAAQALYSFKSTYGKETDCGF
jgi:hypothetical protein